MILLSIIFLNIFWEGILSSMLLMFYSMFRLMKKLLVGFVQWKTWVTSVVLITNSMMNDGVIVDRICDKKIWSLRILFVVAVGKKRDVYFLCANCCKMSGRIYFTENETMKAAGEISFSANNLIWIWLVDNNYTMPKCKTWHF